MTQFSLANLQAVLIVLLCKRFERIRRIETSLSEKLPPLFDHLEHEVSGKDYLVGGSFSIADISIGTMFVNFDHAGEKLDTKRWPKLAAYVERIHARPSFKAMLDEERPFVQRFRAA